MWCVWQKISMMQFDVCWFGVVGGGLVKCDRWQIGVEWLGQICMVWLWAGMCSWGEFILCVWGQISFLWLGIGRCEYVRFEFLIFIASCHHDYVSVFRLSTGYCLRRSEGAASENLRKWLKWRLLRRSPSASSIAFCRLSNQVTDRQVDVFHQLVRHAVCFPVSDCL